MQHYTKTPDNFLNSQEPPGLFESSFSRSGRWWSHILRLHNMLVHGVNGCESSTILMYKKIAWCSWRRTISAFLFRCTLVLCQDAPLQALVKVPISVGNLHRNWPGNSGFSEMMLTMSYFRYFISICFLSIRYLYFCYLTFTHWYLYIIHIWRHAYVIPIPISHLFLFDLQSHISVVIVYIIWVKGPSLTWGW